MMANVTSEMQLPPNSNVMILGDFRADGAYVTAEQMKKLRIRSDPNFHWLIADDVDTTAATTNDHTYDRILAYGDNLLATIVPNSAKPFNFQKEFDLTEKMALRISDHYPVEVELISATPFWMASKTPKTINSSLSKAAAGSLQKEVMTLQRDTLLLEREKLQLQILYLKKILASS